MTVTAYKRRINGKLVQVGWRAMVRRVGYPVASEVFGMDEKRLAKAWDAEKTAAMNAGKVAPGKRPAAKSVADALLAYADAESPKKRGERWERIRLEAMARDLPFRGVQVGKVTHQHIESWIKERTKLGRAANTIRREAGLLKMVFKWAKKPPRRWLATNPMEDVDLPAPGKPRKRMATGDETAAILAALDYREGEPPVTLMQETAYAWLISSEIGLRSKECLLQTVESATAGDGYVRVVDDNKTGVERFAVTTPRADELLAVLVAKARAEKREKLFRLTAASRDALFRKAKARAGVKGLTYHDSRRTATTALARLLTLPELQKTTGIKTVGILLDTYYAPDPAEAAAKLRKPPT